MVRFFSLAALLASAQACTTLIAGKKATKDGSVLATHSDDGESNSDARIVLVPAADHAAGSMRDIFYDTESFPRYVGKGRNIPAYYPKANQSDSKPIGQIPQVNHTYQYFEATYGIINEHQVGIGETTCSGVFGTNAAGHGGKALFSIDSLSRLALERCTTTMGDLAFKHGFYGAGSFEGTAESLMVIDPNEGFIFHILPDDTGSSAIWAAQRVDDENVGVVANMFTIREVDLSNKEKFLGSSNMHTIAKKHGWWKESDGNLDFTKCFSDGEYAHKFYSGRRMWGAYRIWAPNTALPDNYTNLKYESNIYPTEMKPEHKTDPLELMKIHRYYYQGSKYDMTKGVQAGPFGDPDRYSNSERSKVQGNWERSIGLFRTSETHVVQARSFLPNAQGGVVYYAPSCATGSVFTPFAAGLTSLPSEYTTMDPAVVDHASAYWAHRYVYNFAKIRYADMMVDIVALQNKLEAASVALVNKLGASVKPAELTAEYTANAKKVVREWWTLPDKLMAKYADGWLDNGSPIGYPDSWLSNPAVGFTTGPPPPPKPTPSPATASAPAPAPANEVPAVVAVVQMKKCVAGCGERTKEYRLCVEGCMAKY